MRPTNATVQFSPHTGTLREIALAFLKLGVTSFGGPIAHLGYQRAEFVERRAWLDEAQFAQLLAVCQFLPGPASSQMGFAIGLLRGGWLGGLVAFAAFTLPSALLMLALAWAAPAMDSHAGSAVVHGLKLVAVAVVAHSLVGMARQLTPDTPRVAIAACATLLVLMSNAAWTMLGVIMIGGLLGTLVCSRTSAPPVTAIPVRYGPRAGAVCLALFLLALGAALTVSPGGTASPQAMAAAFYKAGALVFGGGHVVLPLLQQAIVEPGWVGGETFLAGYGAAQAVPGPMFTLAAFLGSQIETGAGPMLGAAIALMAVFLPGLLLVAAMLPLWGRLSAWPTAPKVMAGINAAVVGLLAAALYDPVWIEGVQSRLDLAVAAVAFGLLAARRSALWVVVWCVVVSLAAVGIG